MGRPKGSGTKYHAKYCDMIVEYFERAFRAKTRGLAPVVVEQINHEPPKYDSDGKKIRSEKTGYLKREVRQICAELPTIQGFAMSIGIPSSTVKQWAKDHEEFANAFARAKDIQFRLLLDLGLTKQYDPQAFQFVAKNITDMRDTQVLAGDPENPVQVATCMVMRAGHRKEKKA